MDCIRGHVNASKALVSSDLSGHALVAVDDGHHDLLGIGDGNILLMHKCDELDKLLVAELFLNDVLEVEALLFHVAEDMLVDPVYRANELFMTF